MSVPGSRGGSGGIVREGTPQFPVAVCGSEQSGRLVDGSGVWLSFTNAMGLPGIGTFASHGVGGLRSMKGDSTRRGRGCNEIHITKGDSRNRRQKHLHKPDCESSVDLISQCALSQMHVRKKLGSRYAPQYRMSQSNLPS
jgi:hypothetical protein